jgi:hypothetical protein
MSTTTTIATAPGKYARYLAYLIIFLFILIHYRYCMSERQLFNDGQNHLPRPRQSSTPLRIRLRLRFHLQRRIRAVHQANPVSASNRRLFNDGQNLLPRPRQSSTPLRLRAYVSTFNAAFARLTKRNTVSASDRRLFNNS